MSEHFENQGAFERLVLHQEISDVLFRYARALDTKDWKLLREIFTEDGVAIYGDGLPNNGPDAIVRMVRGVLDELDVTQHIISNIELEHVKPDEVLSRCYLHAQHCAVAPRVAGKYVVGGMYRDRLVRVKNRWRIAHRVLHVLWTAGDASILEPADPPPALG